RRRYMKWLLRFAVLPQSLSSWLGKGKRDPAGLMVDRLRYKSRPDPRELTLIASGATSRDIQAAFTTP
ncbi:MAG: hypothetical protein WAW02_07555, partial [Sideroxyarcus sp.]